jgi:RNA recognition motif-containing protein
MAQWSRQGFWYILINKTHKNCGFINFISLDDAIQARNDLNGQDINGLVVKIGFAKVPSKAEVPTVADALATPSIIAGLAVGAAERIYGKAWQKPEPVTTETVGI